MPAQKQNIIQAIKSYGEKLFGFIRSRVRTDEDAEDILQDVWYQLINQSELDDIESVSAWLYRVARNKITDNFRKKKSELLEDYAFEDEDGELYLPDILLEDVNTPETEHLRNLFLEGVIFSVGGASRKTKTRFYTK